MRITVFKISILICVVSFVIVSCNNSTKHDEANLDAVENEVINVQADLVQSHYDATKEFNSYQESSLKKLVENEKVIINLKMDTASKDQSTHELYMKQLDKLEVRNTELKSKIDSYKVGSQQKFKLFKEDFNKDIEDLDISISNMSERN